MHRFRMRVQLQLGGTLNESVAILKNFPITVKEIHAALNVLEEKASKSGWFPKNALIDLKPALVKMSIKAARYPPGGTPTLGAGNIERETFNSDGKYYRLDLENNCGRNLVK